MSTAFRPVHVKSEAKTNPSYFVCVAMFPRLRVRRRLQQHLRLHQDPGQRAEPAVLRVCRQ